MEQCRVPSPPPLLFYTRGISDAVRFVCFDTARRRCGVWVSFRAPWGYPGALISVVRTLRGSLSRPRWVPCPRVCAWCLGGPGRPAAPPLQLSKRPAVVDQAQHSWPSEPASRHPWRPRGHVARLTMGARGTLEPLLPTSIWMHAGCWAWSNGEREQHEASRGSVMM